MVSSVSSDFFPSKTCAGGPQTKFSFQASPPWHRISEGWATEDRHVPPFLYAAFVWILYDLTNLTSCECHPMGTSICSCMPRVIGGSLPYDILQLITQFKKGYLRCTRESTERPSVDESCTIWDAPHTPELT